MLGRLLACLIALVGVVSFSHIATQAEEEEKPHYGVPEIHIYLKDDTLSTINNNMIEDENDPESYHNKRYDIALVTIVEEDGVTKYDSLDYSKPINMKGRGNTTWSLIKKPYQLAFPKKMNLFGMGAAKKWVLLANGMEPSLMRTHIAFDMAAGLNAGEPYNLTGKFIDLYVHDPDGSEHWLGSYYLTHRVGIGESEVNLKSDDAILMELNQPKNYDNNEDSHAVYSSVWNTRLTVKDVASEKRLEDVESAFLEEYDKLEEALNQGDFAAVDKICDVRSFARYYLIEEFTGDSDASVSSVFMYRDGLDDVIHAGTYWDFDRAMGLFSFDDVLFKSPGRLWVNRGRSIGTRTCMLFEKLLEMQPFRKIVEEEWATLRKIYIGSAYKCTALSKEIEASALANQKLWKMDDFHDSLDSMLLWLQRRVVLMNQVYGNNEVVLEDGVYVIGGRDVYVTRLSTGYYRFVDANNGKDLTAVADPSAVNTTNPGNPDYDTLSFITFGKVSLEYYRGEASQKWMVFKSGAGNVVMNVQTGLFLAMGDNLRTVDDVTVLKTPVFRKTDIKLSLDKTSLSFGLLPGEEKTLHATVVPWGYASQVFWESYDESVATVKDGVVKSVGGGVCSIVAYIPNGPSCVCEVSAGGWNSDGKLKYWYENGVKRGVAGDPKNIIDKLFNEERGCEIYDPLTDGWYWLDVVRDGALASDKEVWIPYLFQEDLATGANPEGKWVRYDQNGKMIKGWYTVDSPHDVALYPSQKGNTYYYDLQTGRMMRGHCIIDGLEYDFDENTGVLKK